MDNKKKKVGIVYHPDFLKHEANSYHPENPDRIQAIMDHLREIGILSKLKQLSFSSAEEKWIEEIHDSSYIKHVKKVCQSGGGILDIGDTYTNEYSFEVAKLAVGGCLKAGDEVISGELQSCFCCVRPPGHHSEFDRARGFCIFNNIAILARYLHKQYKVRKIAIIDWDVHHGNGTQYAFYNQSKVYYFSVHQFPHFPGSGIEKETGFSDGKGFTLNIPLPGGIGNEQYEKIFTERLIPEMEKYKPEILLISAGFDGHVNDPLAGMNLTEDVYTRLTEIVNQIASQYCNNRIISILEGGYNLKFLVKSVANHINCFIQHKA